jgi:hypothetical protein
MKEWAKVKARLAEGYTVQQLMEAIDGCHQSPFHCGENEGGKLYQGLELILRDASHVDQFMEIPSGQPVLSEKERRGQRAAESWIERMDQCETKNALSLPT